MKRVGFTGLVQMDLPGQTIRLCDGAQFSWAGELYRNRDPLFGVISAVDPIEEGAGGQIPAGGITMMVPRGPGAAQLSQPGFQKSRVRFWLAEYNADSGQIVGTPDLQFEGWIDQTKWRAGGDARELHITIVSTSERLLELNIGNTMSSAWHKSIWPGETGQDNATGLSRPVAWGVEAPSGAVSYSGGGSNFSSGANYGGNYGVVSFN